MLLLIDSINSNGGVTIIDSNSDVTINRSC